MFSNQQLDCKTPATLYISRVHILQSRDATKLYTNVQFVEYNLSVFHRLNTNGVSMKLATFQENGLTS